VAKKRDKELSINHTSHNWMQQDGVEKFSSVRTDKTKSLITNLTTEVSLYPFQFTFLLHQDIFIKHTIPHTYTERAVGIQDTRGFQLQKHDQNMTVKAAISLVSQCLKAAAIKPIFVSDCQSIKAVCQKVRQPFPITDMLHTLLHCNNKEHIQLFVHLTVFHIAYLFFKHTNSSNI
jgi:hypothetical protein